MAHTRSLLKIGGIDAHSMQRNIVTPDGYYIAGAIDGLGDGVRDDNARRIVACWNACHGVPTEVLEALVSAKSAS